MEENKSHTLIFRLSNSVDDNSQKILKIAIYVNGYLSFITCYNLVNIKSPLNSTNEVQFRQRKSFDDNAHWFNGDIIQKLKSIVDNLSKNLPFMVNIEGLVVTEKYISIPGITYNNIRYDEKLSQFSSSFLISISDNRLYYVNFFDSLVKSIERYRYSNINPDVFPEYIKY